VLIRALLVLMSAACAPEAASTPPVTLSVAPVLSYRYEGATGQARVTREQAADGLEALNGSFELTTGQNPASHIRSTESVAIDARGQLQHAEIAIERARAVDVFTLDPRRGTVRIERTGLPSVDWAVPHDAPWVYMPAALGDGGLALTPISSWVALRAAGSTSVVRVLDPEHQRSYLAPIDQVAVGTELGTTVTLGYDAADADVGFISQLRLSGGALILTRSEPG
jgi:hypothetical protein